MTSVEPARSTYVSTITYQLSRIDIDIDIDIGIERNGGKTRWWEKSSELSGRLPHCHGGRSSHAPSIHPSIHPVLPI